MALLGDLADTHGLVLLAPALRADGYDLAYEEFDGGHDVPREFARRAVEWMIETRRS